MISIKQIKDLRLKTGAAVADCRQALEASGGDTGRALAWLAAASQKTAAAKKDRALAAGAVASYIHSNGALGVLLELRSETDFVSKNSDFRLLAEDLAMQVAAAAPADVEELLAQPFVKEPAQTVGELVRWYGQKFGERIEVGRFIRYEL
ncbi:MAG: elongation factor Ts [Candidatus Vogelbacteria bacterium]|nr:elongation factor Ts [Candidatus Vogelbacteria bacterium]